MAGKFRFDAAAGFLTPLPLDGLAVRSDERLTRIGKLEQRIAIR
jgi:hypothetical protein